MAIRRIGQILVDMGFISDEQLEIALDEQERQPGEKLGKIAEEMGDLLFVMANLARHLGVEPEAALRSANAKFTRRFRAIETALAKDGRRPEDSDLAEMDALWDRAKAAEKGTG